MKIPFFAFAAALVVALPFSAQAKVERVVEKTFTVAPGGVLKVETRGGNIRVETGTSDVVKVVARQRFKAATEAGADEIARSVTLSMEKSGNDVVAVAKFDGTQIRSGLWSGGGNPVQIDFEVSVPSNYRGDLRTSGGNIHVTQLGGDLQASTSGGNIKLGAIAGQADVRTSGGMIEVEDAKGNLKARTSGGNIRVGSVAGTADLSTSGGNIRIESAGGAVDAHTSGGNVTARFASAVPAECDLRTSGGNVTVTVGKQVPFDLEARTSGGNVTVQDLALDVRDGANGKSRLSAKVNGGGAALKLRSSGGSIRIAAN